MMNSVFKTRNSEFKTRNSEFKMMNVAVASDREKQAAFVVLKDFDFKSDKDRSIKLEPTARNW